MQSAAAIFAIPVPVEKIKWLGWNALAVAVYWAVLTFVYVHSVSPINGTDTSLYLRVNGGKVVEGIMWGAVFLPVTGGSWKRPSQFCLALLYLLALVPSLILFGLSDQPRWMMYTILAGCLSVFAGARLPLRIPRFRFRAWRNTGLHIAVGVAGITLAWFLVKGRTTFNFDLLAVYEYRTQANAIFDFGPMGYLATWTFRIMVPYCFCFFLFKKKWMLAAAAFMFQCFCLVLFQEKSVFIPCVMLFLLYFIPTNRAGAIWLIAGFIVSIAGCELVYDIWGNYLLVQVWPRRFFFVQQFLYFNYFDVFSKLGFVYYSDSFMRWFIHYPFSQSPAATVWYYKMGELGGNPNTGFLGAGYMELGQLGVVLSGFAAGFIVRIFDRVMPREMPLWFFGTFAFMPVFSMLISENFVTSLLTGGVAAVIVLLMFTRPDDLNPPARAGASRAGRTA